MRETFFSQWLKSCSAIDRIQATTMVYKNIVRHSAHNIVSRPNPKQWLVTHTFDVMMIIRQSTHSHDHNRGIG